MTSDLATELRAQIKTLNERVWEGRVPGLVVDDWLRNFEDDPSQEGVYALFFLSHFMYFGDFEVRQLLRALYRNLYRYPIIRELRRAEDDTKDHAQLAAAFETAQSLSRFLGIGRPAESGTHLLYFFRQENRLPTDLFIDTHELIDRDADSQSPRLHDQNVERYVFIDDFCGSGQQAQTYASRVVRELKTIAAREGIEIRTTYYCLCGTEEGLDTARATGCFDEVEAVVKLDESFRSLDPQSRYFQSAASGLDRSYAREMCNKYGTRILPGAPLGYSNGQLIVGFHHNIPDNALPIFWCEGEGATSWRPVFKRYQKLSYLP